MDGRRTATANMDILQVKLDVETLGYVQSASVPAEVTQDTSTAESLNASGHAIGTPKNDIY